MEIHKARAFLAVAEELHFGRAAARLHMAQPPLSRLIRSLEIELGATLFERNPRRVALTAVGAALVDPARELVMQAERLTQLVRRVQQGEAGSARLGFAGASVNALVSALARRLRHERPGLTLALSGAELSQPGLERLRAGALDAVVGRWDFLPPDVDSHVMASEDLLIAVADDHRLAQRGCVSPDELADEPWIVLPGGSSATLSNRLHLLGARGRFVPRIVQEAADSATQLLFVAAGIGIGITFSGVRQNLPTYGVQFLPLRPHLGPVDVRIAWRADDADPALAAVIAAARALSPFPIASSPTATDTA